MPKSKLEREFQIDEDGTVVVPKELVPEPTISLTALKKTVKRPMSEKQRENCQRLIEANKIRWAALREAKEKQSPEALSAIKQEEEQLIEKGTHMRLKVREKIPKPRKVKEEVQNVPAPVDVPKPVQKPQKKKHMRYADTTDEDTTETEVDTTDADESEDELPPRHAVRKARRQMKTLAKIDEVIQQVSNPYMSALMGRWK